MNATLTAILEGCEVREPGFLAWVWEQEEVSAYQRYHCGVIVPTVLFLQSILSFFTSLKASDVLVTAGFVFALWSMRSILLRAVYIWFKPMLYHARGICIIQGEAMQPGSIFRETGRIPRCQIAIYSPGLLFDSHIGYGIRVGDVLVMPAHVFAASGTGHMLKNGNNAYFMNETPVFSEAMSDVCYFPLDKAVWTRLQVSSASVADSPKHPEPVVVTGAQGMSNGYVSQSNVKYLLRYTGSTLPGYSGAAYVSNGQVVGMHAGESNSANVGYGMGAIAREIEVLFFGDYSPESKSRRRNFGPARNHYQNSGTGQYGDQRIRTDSAMWDEDTVQEDVRRARGERNLMYTPGAKLQKTGQGSWGSTFDLDNMESAAASSLPDELLEALGEFDASRLRKIRDYVNGLAAVKEGGSFRLRPQSSEGFEEIEVQVGEVPESWKDSVDRRLETLESQMAVLSSHQRQNVVTVKEKPFKCEHCESSFTSKLGAITHMYAKHGDLPRNLETAQKGDEEVPVKTVSFLGQSQKKIGQKPTEMKSSMERNVKPSTSFFPLNTGVRKPLSNPPQSLKMSPSQREFALVFENFQKAIFGLLEAKEQ